MSSPGTVVEAMLAGWSSPLDIRPVLCSGHTAQEPQEVTSAYSGPGLIRGGKKVHGGSRFRESTWEGLGLFLDADSQWQATQRRQPAAEGMGTLPRNLLPGQSS